MSVCCKILAEYQKHLCSRLLNLTRKHAFWCQQTRKWIWIDLKVHVVKSGNACSSKKEVHIRKNRRGNQEWTNQRYLHHWAHKRQDKNTTLKWWSTRSVHTKNWEWTQISYKTPALAEMDNDIALSIFQIDDKSPVFHMSIIIPDRVCSLEASNDISMAICNSICLT
jgi:hypothetical protein